MNNDSNHDVTFDLYAVGGDTRELLSRGEASYSELARMSDRKLIENTVQVFSSGVDLDKYGEYLLVVDDPAGRANRMWSRTSWGSTDIDPAREMQSQVEALVRDWRSENGGRQ